MAEKKNLAIILGAGAGAVILIYLATRAKAVECVIDADCPPGYECVNGKCVPIVPPPYCNKAAFEAAFGSEVGDPNYDPTFDFNGDGVINLEDFVTFADLWEKYCPGIAPSPPPYE